MIQGVHTMFYTSKPEELRAFIRDKLGFPGVDVGEGWIIFTPPGVDMGCHPSDTPGAQPSGMHYISFWCDDIEKTVAGLRGRGVEFTSEVHDVGYGRAIEFKMPGDFEATLYERGYASPNPAE